MSREVHVVAPPPLIFLGALGAGLALEAALPSADVPAAVGVPLGIALVTAGGALAGSFVRSFRRARTPIAFQRVSHLVTSGPYRVSRNPGYLGMALTVAGIGALVPAPWVLAPLALAVAVVDRGVIAREERYLEQRFGGEYDAYRSRVRRWI